MAKIEIILTQNMIGLGAESDHVKVAAGYARNYLFPQGLAIPVSAANKRRLEVLRQRRAERESHELNSMLELAKMLSKVTLVVTVKTGESERMFGSITAGTIVDELKHQFDITLDKKKIHLEKPIRNLGEHEIELRLHGDVAATLKLRVESSTPPPTPIVAPASSEETGAVKASGKKGDKPDKTERSEKGGQKRFEGRRDRTPRTIKNEPATDSK